MLTLPALRWGKPYQSLDVSEITHFATGAPIARISQINGGIIHRDLRQAQRAREALRQLSCEDLVHRCQQAADRYLTADLPMGDGTQSPDQFVHHQSASTGLPEAMCRRNMEKNSFVLKNMADILDALTRGLDLEILSRGYGVESRGVTVSYQAQTPVLGAVLPSNSPGVHTLWLPAVPLQIGLALKPGSAEPWTPYRIVSAFIDAGIPAEAFSLYPGGHDTGPALLSACPRSMVFGSRETVAQYAGNPRIQPHGPGFSKILLGDDVVDQWPDHLDLMVDSVLANAGRSCINCSGIWASRHTRQIADALAERLGPIEVQSATDPEAELAAFTDPAVAEAVWNLVAAELEAAGTTDMTARFGPRLELHARCAYLRPVVAHCDSATATAASKEYLFPFVSVVQCPQAEILSNIGPTLVATAITQDPNWIGQLTDAVQIDRLNIGPIATHRLNWRQPHEGNIMEFLFRSRAYQVAKH